MRKSNDFEVSDNIKIYYESSEEFSSALKLYEDYIKDETLAVEINPLGDKTYEEQNLNGHETKLFLERI